MTFRFLLSVLLLGSTVSLHAEEPVAVQGGGIRIMQLMRNPNAIKRYPDALPSLLKMMNEQTSARFDTDPLEIPSLTDERLLENPILYVNCDDQPNLEFAQEERDALRRYMEQGGFVYLDAGIKCKYMHSDIDTLERSEIIADRLIDARDIEEHERERKGLVRS